MLPILYSSISEVYSIEYWGDFAHVIQVEGLPVSKVGHPLLHLPKGTHCVAWGRPQEPGLDPLLHPIGIHELSVSEERDFRDARFLINTLHTKLSEKIYSLAQKVQSAWKHTQTGHLILLKRGEAFFVVSNESVQFKIRMGIVLSEHLPKICQGAPSGTISVLTRPLVPRTFPDHFLDSHKTHVIDTGGTITLLIPEEGSYEQELLPAAGI